MLKGIHPLLGPELLHALQTMGHGDDIVIADANFPSSFLGPKVIRADGVDATMMAEAILTHMPLDTFVPEAAWRKKTAPVAPGAGAAFDLPCGFVIRGAASLHARVGDFHREVFLAVRASESLGVNICYPLFKQVGNEIAVLDRLF